MYQGLYWQFPRRQREQIIKEIQQDMKRQIEQKMQSKLGTAISIPLS